MGQPKALLKLGEYTFLENILRAIAQSSVSHTAVVLGHHREAIERTVPLNNAIFNPDYESGMITSIKAGIFSLPQGSDGALLFLVDHPVIDVATINELIRRFEAGRIILPTYQGRRGHPVLFAREVLDEILALPISVGANIVVRRDPSRVIEVAVTDRGVILDVDTPEQFEELRRGDVS